MKKYLPIRKVAVTAVGGALTWAAMRAGADFGSDSINQAATVLVGLVFAYAEKDPRVVTLLDDAVTLVGRVEHTAKAAEPPASPEA